MGKHGAFELNYSSDIDFSIFYAPDRLPVAEGHEPQAVAVRIANHLGRVCRSAPATAMSSASTCASAPIRPRRRPPCRWTRPWTTTRASARTGSAPPTIKARVAAGDFAEGQAFLEGLQPFIWRRNLDFAAIADIHSIKRQIHAYKVDDRLTAKGADLKLGRGGIREIEFSRPDPAADPGRPPAGLRGHRTLDALAALAAGAMSRLRTPRG